MRLRLEGCAHPRAIPYEIIVNEVKQPVAVKATCPTCYRRIRVTAPPDEGHVVEYDTPAVMCQHTHKKPISEAITRRLPYMDALCTDCGRVLRHPDGPGRWAEVIFYGFLIYEEP